MAAAKYCGDIDAFTGGCITRKPTLKEPKQYYRDCIVDHADWSAVDPILAKNNISPATFGDAMFIEYRTRYVIGMGGVPIVGDPGPRGSPTCRSLSCRPVRCLRLFCQLRG